MREGGILLVEEAGEPQSSNLWGEVDRRISGIIDTDPCYIIFTSGSTGDPKGVTISHRGVIDYIAWARECYAVTEDEVIGNQAPLFFDNSTLDLYLCMSTGATLHFIPEMCYRFPVRLLDYLEMHRISFIFWVPSVLVTVANFDLMRQRVPSHLRKILFAGEVMPAKQLRYWMEKLPGALFSDLYGPTEITVDCTYYHVPHGFEGDSIPIGRPCRNTNVLVLDEENRPAGVQEVGELCVRGSSLALGYWNNPGETRRVFCQNPLHAFYNDPIYRTGDLVFRDSDGLIHFVGRKDNQIKHHGYRIELGEIEASALAIPAIGQCSAVYNHEAQEIHLFLELIGGDLADVQKELASRLPRYMVPNRYHLLDKLPLTPNGKIDRRNLQQLTCREA
jgi:amino acid adenylation domain-containing protein